MTRLNALYSEGGQSPWIDDLHREWLGDGHLKSLVDQGVRGITSNPTIFAKAISESTTYDAQLFDLVPSHSIDDAYWEMVIDDIEKALAILHPVHESAKGADGFVSLEVAPSLATTTTGTFAAATQLHNRINKENLLVKVPATKAGLPALRRLFGEGRSINVTLIFGLDRYDAVVEAYLSGLEDHLAAGATDLSHIASVASFFVSRTDTEIDARLEAVGSAEALSLRGRAAVAQAQIAYQHFRNAFSGERWERLARHGGRVQRPLWASTSTKNPSYPDLLYVETLIGPDTVNTMPGATLDHFLDHGEVARTIDANVDQASETLEQLAKIGIDLTDVSETLEKAGVASFAKSFDDLLAALTKKAASR
jgi:transaldolase